MRPRAGGLESAWAGGLEEPEQQMRRPRRGPAWAGPGRLAGGRCRAYALLYTVIIPLFCIIFHMQNNLALFSYAGPEILKCV
jgi:hypothetical protein